jgi:hypothetical protein
MSAPLIGGLIEAGMRVLDRILPNQEAKAAAQLELLKLQQAGEFKQLEADLQRSMGQLEINKAEAGSSDSFVARWRPAMGWCCVAIFAANYIVVPMLAWVSTMVDIPVPPRLDMGEVWPVLAAMLGIDAGALIRKAGRA